MKCQYLKSSASHILCCVCIKVLVQEGCKGNATSRQNGENSAYCFCASTQRFVCRPRVTSFHITFALFRSVHQNSQEPAGTLTEIGQNVHRGQHIGASAKHRYSTYSIAWCKRYEYRCTISTIKTILAGAEWILHLDLMHFEYFGINGHSDAQT